jgi:predicted Co/Zn/Cd cation transporter (cation efflux family)
MSKSDDFNEEVHKRMVLRISDALQASWSMEHTEYSNMSHEMEALTVVLAIRARVMGVPLTTVVSALAEVHDGIEIMEDNIH